jgi:hypothetical protein
MKKVDWFVKEFQLEIHEFHENENSIIYFVFRVKNKSIKCRANDFRPNFSLPIFNIILSSLLRVNLFSCFFFLLFKQPKANKSNGSPLELLILNKLGLAFYCKTHLNRGRII